MESLQRKTNSAFASPEKDSPTKKNATAADTLTASKKGFFQMFTKKKPVEQDLELQAKPNEAETNTKVKQKQKFINRKNIADGRIRLNIFDNDRVPEDYMIDYRDNMYDVLDQNPVRTTSYIENLKSRDFSQINNKEVRQFIESQKQNSDIIPSVGVGNLEHELLELTNSYDNFLAKFFRFFQGLLPGFCIIHLFLVFAASETALILSNYADSCLRIYQIFHIVALLSVVGAFNRYMQARTQYQEAVRCRPMLKEGLGKQVTKYIIASVCFLVVYGIIIYNHEFVAKLSDKAGETSTTDFSSTFGVFRGLSVIKALFASVGWLTLVLAFEDLEAYNPDNINYSDLTGDTSEGEDE
jgi:hypothetical protein